jgi:spermidine/putrescine transport system ATP-binding protein
LGGRRERVARHTRPPPPPARHCALRCTVAEIVYLGTSTSYSVVTNGGATVSVYRQNTAAAPGEEIAQGQVGWLSWPPEHSYVLGSTPAAKEGTRS